MGYNLQDHISTYLGPFFVNKPSSTFSIERDVNVPTIAQYFSTGRGILTTSGAQAMGFFASDQAKAAGEAEWPDTQIVLVGVTMGPRFGDEMARGFGPRRATMRKYLAHAAGQETFIQIISLGRPHAKGRIRLASRDPYADPVIDPNYLSNQHDIDVIVAGMKKSVALVENTRTFRELGGRFTTVPFPGCEGVVFKSDAYWECYARQLSITLHHIVGTAAMGPKGKGVVDTELRVRRIRGLRVVDASVMPVVPVGESHRQNILPYLTVVCTKPLQKSRKSV